MLLDPFFESQLAAWPTARDHYERLKRVQYRTIDFDGFQIHVQYNPDRILSATAKIDAQSLQARACFLCQEHMPREQEGLEYSTALDIRVNPYPIFSRHFTVPAKEHTPQLIAGHVDDLLSIARAYPAYTVFYNGPRSGASAPDHFHFQLAPRHVMPLERDVMVCPRDTLHVSPGGHVLVESIPRYLRKNILLRASRKEALADALRGVLTLVGEIVPGEPEPMVNLFAWHADGAWWVVIFPRRAHRPWQFFAEGDARILFSPGCVDFAGLIISPREVDFKRLDAPMLQDLFGQLTLTGEQGQQLIDNIQSNL